VLSGPSGVGKGTVLARVMAGRGETASRLRRSISVTTRARRPEEQEGRDYFFQSPERFTQMTSAGELLEWAPYLDHNYGTPREWVDQQLAAGYDVALEIEVQGAMQVRQHCPEAVLIYMLPPSWRALRRRLARRRSESGDAQAGRLEVARKELDYIPHYDYLIINDRVDRCARRLEAILQAEHARVDRADLDGIREGLGV
jgi:guanylate kinase